MNWFSVWSAISYTGINQSLKWSRMDSIQKLAWRSFQCDTRWVNNYFQYFTCFDWLRNISFLRPSCWLQLNYLKNTFPSLLSIISWINETIGALSLRASLLVLASKLLSHINILVESKVRRTFILLCVCVCDREKKWLGVVEIWSNAGKKVHFGKVSTVCVMAGVLLGNFHVAQR